MLKQQIADEIIIALKALSIEELTPQVDYPADPKHGDYATNVALIAAKKLGKSPREVAEGIIKQLQSQRFDSAQGKLFAKVEVAGPGFINFWINDDELTKVIDPKKHSTKRFDVVGGAYAGKKVIIEFTDPNPFKEFHIGHLYSNIVGESLSRLLEAAGAEVKRVDYFGDVGMHVAKSLWGLQNKLQAEGLDLQTLGAQPLKERIAYLGKSYALGATAFEEDTTAAEEMKVLNRLIYIAAQKMWQEVKGLEPKIDYRKEQDVDEKQLAEVYHLYTVGREWSMEYFEEIFHRLGTHFDGYYPESIAAERGFQLVMEHLRKGIFEESQGAIVFPGEKQGLHTRVFINQLGLPTYEAKELGLAPWKYEEFAYDTSIIVTGNEINEYFKVLIAALKKVNPELGEKTKHLSHGMVKLPEGKMSSRTGKIVTGEWLLDEAKTRALKLSDSEDIAEMVGVGAIKYALLKGSIGKDVEFSFDESVSFEGNSGPYLQYTFARTQSVLTKANQPVSQVPNPKSLVPEERDLLRLLARFDEIVADAANRFAPSAVATYLFELAQAFNLFYQKHQIVVPSTSVREELERMQFRLALTASVGLVLKQGLHLLGIQAPERM